MVLAGNDLLIMWKMEIPRGTDLVRWFQSAGKPCAHTICISWPACIHLYCINFCLFTGHSSNKQVEFRWLRTCSAGSGFLPHCTLEYSSVAAACCYTATGFSVTTITHFPNVFFSICIGTKHTWSGFTEKIQRITREENSLNNI